MRRRFALVYNDRAGGIRPMLLDRVLSHVTAQGGVITPVEATGADDATALVRAIAREGGADAVIAAGGDGTIRAVAAGLDGSSIPAGIIPLGTGNVMKYEIGLSGRPQEIAATLLSGAPLDVPGGLVNGAPFFLMVGAGFDGHIVSKLNQKTKHIAGRAAYTAPVLSALARGAALFDVEVDGAAYEASWLIVTNAAHYGGSFVLTRETQIGAGKLVAILITGKTRGALLSAGFGLARGRLGDPARAPRGVLVLPAHTVRAGVRRIVPIEIDGDEGGMSPIEVRAGGPHFKLLVPPAYVAGLTKRHTNRLR